MENLSNNILSQTTEVNEDTLQVGSQVTTPYGIGEVLERRTTDKQVVVALNGNGKAYLQEDLVKRKKKLFEMDDGEKLLQSKQHREEGNLFFKLEDYIVALNKYELARVYLRQLLEPKKEESLSLLNNIALANIKLGRFADAVQTCDEGVKTNFSSANDNLNSAEVKCLYLRALANRKRGDLETALRDLVRAVKSAPKNKPVREEYESIVKEMKSVQNKEAALFRNAFAESKLTSANDESSKAQEQQKETPASKELKQHRKQPQEEQQGFLATYGTTVAIGAAAIALALLILSRPKQ